MFKKTFIAGAVLLAALGAQAQTLAVTGTVNPASCSVSFPSGATLDWGSLSAMTVRTYVPVAGHYMMSTKTVPYIVQCDAPAVVYMTMTDAYAGLKTSLGAAADVEANRYGLVDGGVSGTGTTAMGAVSIKLNRTAVKLDGFFTTGSIMAPAGTTLWSPQDGSAEQVWGPGVAVGWAATLADVVPQAASKYDGSMNIMPYVNKAYLDAATSVISMKAATTLTLKYL